MAEQDSTKQGQGSGMAPLHTGENVPIVPDPLASVPAEGPMLDSDLQAHIGRQLRTVYEEVLSEAVPDRFLKLLEELERKQTGRS
jgi:hypothetical protein